MSINSISPFQQFQSYRTVPNTKNSAPIATYSYPAQDTFKKQSTTKQNLIKTASLTAAVATGIALCVYFLKKGKVKNAVKTAQTAATSTADNKFLKYFRKGIDEKISRIPQGKGRTVTKGNTVSERVQNFINNPDYISAPKGNLPQIMGEAKLTPHSYNTALQDIHVMSRSAEADHAVALLKGTENHLPGIRNILGDVSEVNRYGLKVGKTPAGKAFVECGVLSSRVDFVGRPIVNTYTIISKNGEFTQVQKDLIKSVGSHTDKMSSHTIPVLNLIRENPQGTEFAIAEDTVLSGIHSLAKITPQNQTNRFLESMGKLKNGEFIFDGFTGMNEEKMLTESILS